MMFARSLLIAFVVIFLSSNAYSGNATGNTYKFGCRLLASDNRVPIGKFEAVKAGECSSAIDVIFMLRRALDQSIRFCPPPRVALGQNAKIVVMYANNQLMHMQNHLTLLVVSDCDG